MFRRQPTTPSGGLRFLFPSNSFLYGAEQESNARGYARGRWSRLELTDTQRKDSLNPMVLICLLLPIINLESLTFYHWLGLTKEALSQFTTAFGKKLNNCNSAMDKLNSRDTRSRQSPFYFSSSPRRPWDKVTVKIPALMLFTKCSSIILTTLNKSWIRIKVGLLRIFSLSLLSQNLYGAHSAHTASSISICV